MNKKRVLVVQSRPDPVAERLVARLRASTRLMPVAGDWTDTRLAAELAESRPIEADIIALVCPAVRNQELSRALLAQFPELLIVRIDTASQESPRPQLVTVDLVQHLRVDQREFGFDRLLNAMDYLAENHGVGMADRLVRYLVVDDERSLSGKGVRFLEVAANTAAADTDRDLPPVVREWLNATIRAYFERNPAATDGSLGVSRERAQWLISQLGAGDTSGEAEAKLESRRAATRSLIAFLRDQANAQEPLVLLWRRLEIPVSALLAFLICLAPELDLRYQLIFWHIHDDVTRRHASVSLVDALLSGETSSTHRSAIAALLRWRLIIADPTQPESSDQALRPDPVIVRWLMSRDGGLEGDLTLQAVLRDHEWPGERIVTDDSPDHERFVVRGLKTFDPQIPWCVLTGADLEGWRALIERGAALAQTRLLRIRLEVFTEIEAHARDEVAVRLARLARLTCAHIVIDASVTPVNTEALVHLVAAQERTWRTGYLLIADSRIAAAALPRNRWRYDERSTPSLATRKARFSTVLRELDFSPGSESEGISFADRLAAAYPLDLQGLTTASALALAQLGGVTAPEARERVFSAACRMVATPDLLQLAHRLEPIYEIKSVILPNDRLAQLEEIVANVQHSRTVLENWGFGAQLAYGRGVAALFAGPSGTGKTMAAQAIAKQLGVDVFAVDLARIVSKYIGETEKHLDAVFADAERSGSVLLFDEADALFGKRSEVKDAHDRYANLEVAYLLQRMEAFGGLAILTTNHRQNLDCAFVRRLRFIVEFPKPDADARRKIWELCFPLRSIVDEDVDWRVLARFDLSGGTIRQVTLRAAFMAARDGSKTVTMQHLLTALRGELTKLGMQTAERELTGIDQLRAQQQRAQKQDAA